MSKRIRVGVMGVGNMGSVHVENLAKHRIVGAQLVALMDPDVDRLRQIGEETGVSLLFEESQPLVQSPEVDAVLIAAPDRLHASLALECLQAGKPALVEKPLATQVADAKQVVEAEVRQGKRMLQVGFMREYDPAHVEVKQIVDQGNLGSRLMFHGVHRNALHPPGRSPAALIVNSMIHDIHSARWMMEDDVVRVFAQVLPESPQAPNTARLGLAQLQFRQGGLGLLECNSASSYGYEVDVEVTCEEGTVVSNTKSYPMVNWKFAQQQRVPEDWRERFAWAYRQELNAWIQGLGCGQLTGPSAWDGYMATLIAEACIQSVSSGAAVEVPGPEKPAMYG